MKSKQDLFHVSKIITPFLRALKKADVSYLLQNISTQASMMLALLVGALYVAYLFPFQFIAGHGGFFEQQESLISLSGWWSFKREAWRFPLLQTQLLNRPEGANIAFTNSIPLLALLFKPFRYWLPQHFHYLGLWATLAYLLQAISASLIVRVLGHRTLLASLTGSLMGLMMPVLLYQTVNVGLFCQAYLLFGLTLYFQGVNNPQDFQKTAKYFTGLLSISLLTHPYLFVMASTFYIACLGDLSRKGQRYQKEALLAFGISLCVILAILFLGGYFQPSLSVKGYGQYAMNMLAPFSGGKLGLPVIHATSGQHRGFNYLGGGVWFALCLTLVMHNRLIGKQLKQHRTLLGLLLMLTLFSLSHRVFYAKKLLIQLPLFFPLTVITELFPSSGRLFWPCGYTLMVIGVMGVLSLEKKISVWCVALMLTLQWYDTIPLRKVLYQATHRKAMSSTQWARLVQKVGAIHLYPAYSRGVTTVDPIIFWQALATRYGRPINTAYIHRNKGNATTKHKAFQNPLHKNHLYIVATGSQRIPNQLTFAMEQGWCKKTDKGLLCLKGTNYNFWKQHFPKKNNTYPPLKKGIKRPVLKKKKQYVDWPDDVF